VNQFRCPPLLFSFVLVLGGVARADWPNWRGPTGMGQTDVKGLPVTWGGKQQENVLWKVPLFEAADKVRRDHNQSSPIVSGDRVFVTISYWPPGVSEKEHPEHHVLCFRAADGRRMWDTRVPPGPWLLKDLRGGYTAPTPASDGERVYVMFGSSVLAALDREGQIVWRKEIVPFDFDVAAGSSPVLHGELVLLLCDQVRSAKTSRLLAFDRKTGALQWERKRLNQDFSHSTPVLARVKDRLQLLVAAAGQVQGLDPENGQVLWWCAGAGDTASPVYAEGVVFCDGGRGGPGVAVEPTGSGDLTKTHLKWKVERIPSGFSSPVVVGEYLYRLHDPGVLRCWQLKTGTQLFAERLEGVETAASPIATPEGRIYCATAGRSYVVQAGPKLEILAVNDLGDPGRASPAVAEGRLFLKGSRYLFCIGKK
jgi:outer membrane protein assembly factor BamB